MIWQPIETAPKDGLILLTVEALDGERRTFPAEASHHDGQMVWLITTGWGGWKSLHSSWRPVAWMPLPPPPEGDKP
jgi:hypothetical protein